MECKIVTGGRHEDARGVLRFCNDFDMSAVRRFYTVSNSAEHSKRGWIMHKRETKWFFPIRGTTIIRIEDALRCSPSPLAFTLAAQHPAVLQVPPNHWFMIEQDGNAEVMVFSNCHVGEFQNDDFRRDAEAPNA